MTPPTLKDSEIAGMISYDPETGILRWKQRVHARFLEGDECGTIDAHGYRQLQLRRRFFKAHRVAWFLHYGRWPEGGLDHINRDRSDNRICNLREATPWQNNANQRTRNDSTTRAKGVSRTHDGKKWRGTVQLRGKTYTAGRFDHFNDAVEAVKRLRQNLHGDFARHA